MKKWLLITLVASAVLIVVVIVVILVMQQQKRQEQEARDAAELAAIEQQLPLPDELLKQRNEVLDPETFVSEPGDFEPYWGEVDPTMYNLDRVEPTTEEGIRYEVESILQTYLPIILTYLPGDDPVDDSIGVAADFLTPELTGELIDTRDRDRSVNGTEATVENLTMQKKNETTYAGTAVMKITNFQIFTDPNVEDAPEQREDFGTSRTLYDVEVTKVDHYWYISKLHEQQ